MSAIYDNWERLVAAVVKRQEIWQLCHDDSSPSIRSGSSESFPSFDSSDEEEIYDHKFVPKHWERLVAAVLKRQEIWQLCHDDSRSPSISSGSSESFPSFRSSDEEEVYDQKFIPKLVFLGGSNPGFRLKHTLKGLQELGMGTFGTTILTQLSRDVNVSDHEFLENGTKMVTKLLKEVRVTEEEFKQQMMVFQNCRHDNVAAPRAYCFSNKANGKLIVYDYHNQGSVFDMLQGKEHLATWESRLKVAIGAARGIAHIHKQCGGKMAHGNIKSSNIFLNSQQYGCVSDFGLQTSIMAAQKVNIYLAYQAEKFRSRNLSQESDIYWFGILLLELLTGKLFMRGDKGFGADVNLMAWVRSIKYEEFSNKLFDQNLRYDEEDRLQMVEMQCIAMRCLEAYTICRPKMSDVLLMLDSISRPCKIWSCWRESNMKIYDNWERLVAAVLKRQQIWELCHDDSRSPSISSGSSESFPSFDSSDEEEIYDQIFVPKLVFLGGSNPGFCQKHILKGLQELGKGTFGTTILTQLTRDVNVSDHEFLENGTIMATKLLKEVRVTQEEFKQQMMDFQNCRHDNVAAPRAYYFSNKADGKLIVYDYHNQGSVFDMLQGKKHLATWESRLKVAIGAARGIAHIHKQCGGKMAHGNIKSSNIFLNSQQYGCVSDFGLKTSIMAAQKVKIYLAYQAEEFSSGNLSQECDIYRLGMLLLELLTGKPFHLMTWVRSIKYEEYSDKLFDQNLRYDEEDRLEMVEMLCIAMRCLKAHTISRPTMSDVLLMLDSISRPYKIWSSWM